MTHVYWRQRMSVKKYIASSIFITFLSFNFTCFANDAENPNGNPPAQQNGKKWYKTPLGIAGLTVAGLGIVGGAGYGIYAAIDDDNTKMPSLAPSSFPTRFPSPSPSAFPSASPSSFPTPFPSALPSSFPSDEPSSLPSNFPSFEPTRASTSSPTQSPTLAIQCSSPGLNGVCTCTPLVYNFELDFSLDCPEQNTLIGNGVDDFNCFVAPGGINLNLNDTTFVVVSAVDILELDENLIPFAFQPLRGAFRNGDEFTYTSAVGDRRIGGLQINILGFNAIDESIQSIFIVDFTDPNVCGAPILSPDLHISHGLKLKSVQHAP